MIKKLKYRLAKIINSRRVRTGSTALCLAFTIFVATLLGCPIHTEEIFAGEKFYTLNLMFPKRLTEVPAEKTEKVKTYPVYVTCGEETFTVDFTVGTVADALVKAGFTPDEDDFIEPSLDTVINDTVYIDYANVEYVEGFYTETVAFDTETVYDSAKQKGYTALSQKGVNGETQVYYTEKLVNGVSTEKTVTETKVLTAPKNEIKVVGTKVEQPKVEEVKTEKVKTEKAEAVKTSADVKCISTLNVPFEIELDENGNPVNYKSKRTARATAYTYTGNNCSTGVAPQPGYIAVNPKVIPYGTKMYIKSADGSVVYGYAVAAATGGFIRNHPTGVDLFMSTKSACINFGVRTMEIYILE